MPQEKTQAWIQRIPVYIKEIIVYKDCHGVRGDALQQRQSVLLQGGKSKERRPKYKVVTVYMLFFPPFRTSTHLLPNSYAPHL